ncbi:MAG: glycosyltransferase [Ruminococcus sp.]|nr:glycosyltransferase [Ruminococcus sp.]
MSKIALYIDSMQRGGAQRVMSVLSSHFLQYENEVLMINDVLLNHEIEYPLANGIKRIILERKSNNPILNNYNRVKQLRKIVKQEKVDIILSFLGPTNQRMLVATLGLRVKKFVSVRNDPTIEYGKGIKKIVANILFLLADGTVFQTEEARSYFSKRIQKKSKVIFNPVAELFYDQKWNCARSDIAVVGRLQPQKRPDLAVKAFAEIADEFPETKLVFYGAGELEDTIWGLSKQFEIDDRVTVYGNTNEIAKKLSESALFMMCSDFEGMPNALMEAMAIGVPVISTDCPCGGPRSLIQNDMQGILVPCNDVISLANALRKVLGNLMLQKDMSVRERQRAFSFRTPIILEIWDDYLKGDK